MSTVVPNIDDFRHDAIAWLEANRSEAPADYGPILPPRLRAEGVAWQRRLFAAGYAGLHWPVEFGGRGLSPDHQAVWLELCAAGNVPPFINMVGFVLAGQSIQLFGTAEQKAEHLRPIITGDRVWCQLFSEPEAGSDLAGLTTAAERDGDTYVVTGQKVWCSGGRIGDWGILMARTDRGVKKHRGISFFLVDMASAGIVVRPLRQMNGESEFDEVVLTDVRVPARNLLGPENDGWRVGMVTLTNERGSIGAAAVATERRLAGLLAMGGGLSPVQRQQLVELWSRGRIYGWLGQRGDGGISSSLSKLGVTEMMFDAAMVRAGLDGAHAMLDGPAAHQACTAPGGRIAGGTSQVQRNIIAERILGLPK